MSSQVEFQADAYSVQVYDRPGKSLPLRAQRQLRDELRTFAALSLQPLPDYQCLSSAPDALDDKLIVAMRYTAPPQQNQIVAFLSAVYLSIPPSRGADGDASTEPLTVLHTGLTCVAPGARRTGMTAALVLRLVTHARAQPAFAHGVWLTSLAEVPSSLGSVLQYATRVHPAPGAPPPSATHLRIADAVAMRFRGIMLVSPDAIFDRERFVFRGSNPPGSCFRKDGEDERWRHREERVNAFYLQLLGRNEGNEVLQVAFVDWDHLFSAFEKAAQRRKRTGRTGTEEKKIQKAKL